jgi:hypothetical protein
LVAAWHPITISLHACAFRGWLSWGKLGLAWLVELYAGRWDLLFQMSLVGAINPYLHGSYQCPKKVGHFQMNPFAIVHFYCNEQPLSEAINRP